MKFLDELTSPIPSHFNRLWPAELFRICRFRFVVMVVMAVVGFLSLHLYHAFVVQTLPLKTQLLEISIFIVASGLLVLVNAQTKSKGQAKLVAFLALVCLHAFLVTTAMSSHAFGQPYAFSFAVAMAFIFVSVMIPWNLLETFFVSILSFAAFTSYHLGQILRANASPEILMKDQLFVSGLIVLGLVSLFCFVVRLYDNFRLKKVFMLSKTVEVQRQKIEELNCKIKHDLSVARKVHRTLMPKSFENEHLSIQLQYEPVTDISGDYANFYFLDHKTFMFLIIDVDGHGVPAALVVNRVESEFQRLAQTSKDPGEVLNLLNLFLLEQLNETGVLLTAFCGLVDLESGKFIYSSHGHPDQYLVRAESIVKLRKMTGLLGTREEDREYSSELELVEGDQLLLFTDGVCKGKSKAGEPYGEERLLQLIETAKDKKKARLGELLRKDLKKYAALPLKDDIFILSIQYKKASLSPVY